MSSTMNYISDCLRLFFVLKLFLFSEKDFFHSFVAYD